MLVEPLIGRDWGRGEKTRPAEARASKPPADTGVDEVTRRVTGETPSHAAAELERRRGEPHLPERDAADELPLEDDAEVDDEDEGLPKTKQGYVKDDFVVSSDEEEEEELEEEVEVEEVKPKKDKKKVIAKPKKPKLRDEVEITICCEELEEEPYV